MSDLFNHFWIFNEVSSKCLFLGSFCSTSFTYICWMTSACTWVTVSYSIICYGLRKPVFLFLFVFFLTFSICMCHISHTLLFEVSGNFHLHWHKQSSSWRESIQLAWETKDGGGMGLCEVTAGLRMIHLIQASQAASWPRTHTILVPTHMPMCKLENTHTECKATHKHTHAEDDTSASLQSIKLIGG